MAPIALRMFGETDSSSNQIALEQWVRTCLTTGLAIFLVLLGGLFAGLTLAFMGQDKVYLQVLRISGTEREKRDASKVLRVLQRGKHWILVTLLISNVITNETLPIVLDHWLSGGWPAILTSTVLVLLFGEIVPQSVCATYGLRIAAQTSTLLQIQMYLLSPVAYPIARLLDWFLGEERIMVYGKRRLKALISFQKSLDADEVTLVSAALDLKETRVSSLMTPMSHVFTLESDARLNEVLRQKLWASGYNQIPVHASGDSIKFIGVFLVKDLIINEPGEIATVSEMELGHLPIVSPASSSLDMMKYFRSGRSHMVLVTDCGTSNGRALGILTLSDIIEYLIKE